MQNSQGVIVSLGAEDYKKLRKLSDLELGRLIGGLDQLLASLQDLDITTGLQVGSGIINNLNDMYTWTYNLQSLLNDEAKKREEEYANHE